MTLSFNWSKPRTTSIKQISINRLFSIKNYRRVRTLYACLAENDGELSFEPNQIITNGELNWFFLGSLFFIFCFFFSLDSTVRPSSEPGWLDGTLNGKSGLIPENYVEVLP